VLIAIKAQALALLALTQEQLGVIVRASGRSSKHRTVLGGNAPVSNHALHGLLDTRLRGHDNRDRVSSLYQCQSAWPDAFGGADCTVREKRSKNNQAA
jgi:hypothetical protein